MDIYVPELLTLLANFSAGRSRVHFSDVTQGASKIRLVVYLWLGFLSLVLTVCLLVFVWLLVYSIQKVSRYTSSV